MQTFPEKYAQGMIRAAKDIIATEGIGFLLAGLGDQSSFLTYYAAYHISPTHQQGLLSLDMVLKVR
jgi:hypothetical protein